MNIKKLRESISELKSLHPNDDYGTEKCWKEETEILSENISDTIDFFENQCTDKEFSRVKSLYNGITEDSKEDPDYKVNYMLNKPFEITKVYCNTVIGDGEKSLEIIYATENVLYNNGIDFLYYTKVMFTSVDEFKG